MSANAQNFRKTNFTAPLKGTASFTDSKFKNFDPVLIHLDQNPIPYAEYGNKKELLHKKRLATDLSDLGAQKTSGAAPNPIILNEWRGNTGSGTPFDNDVAISNDGTIISAVNANIRVYDTSGVLDFVQNINAMDSVTGLFSWISDPRLLYDPKEDRFILVCFSGNISTSSNIIVGFSTTNNPADDWNFYTLDGSPYNDGTWSDYPIIAISDKDLFMTWNHIIDNIGWQNGFKESVIYQIKKDDGYLANALNFTIWDSLQYNGVYYRNICPARYQETNMGDDMYFLSIRNVDLSNDSVFILHIDDSYQSNNATLTQKVIQSPVDYGFPPNVPMGNGQYLMTNDGRVLSAMYENDRIHFGANSVNPLYNNAGLLLGEIQNVSNATPTITADILSGPMIEYGYPSMTWVGHGTENKVLYTFGHCYTDSFPGLSMLYKNSAGYSDVISIEDGQNAINALADSNERWGDYSGIQKMYNDPSRSVLVGAVTRNGGRQTRVAMVTHQDFAVGLNDVENNGIASTVFPNPVLNRFTTRFELPAKQVLQFNLYDMNGRLVQVMLSRECKKGKNEFSFNTGALSKGNYVFAIEGSGQRYAKELLTIK